MNSEYNGWTKNIWRKEDQDDAIIRLQRYFIGILCIIVIFISIGWMRSPSKLTIHIPPDISNGAAIPVGSIPAPLIHSFAYQVWQDLNSWPKNGKDDYKNNIETFWSYLTPQFKSELLNDYEELQAAGQTDRTRFIQGVNAASFDEKSVKKIGNDTWEVNLKMSVIEYKNNQQVKNIVILYPLKVTRMQISERLNPYGLALAGFTKAPKRISKEGK